MNTVPEDAPTFVNALWQQLAQSFSPRAEKRLARFARQRGVTKWIIATDFCMNDAHRPNDSFAFVIFPAGERLEEINRLLATLPTRDLKDVRRVPQSVMRLLTSGRIFSVCFVADRTRKLFPDADAAGRASMIRLR